MDTKLVFNTTEYKVMYCAMLILIARVDAHKYHGARFRQMLAGMRHETKKVPIIPIMP